MDNEQTNANSPSITVYWLNESRADRILFLLEELEVPYAIEKFDRGSDKLAPADLKKIHPLGKSPVIKDGDRVVAESGVIIDYLITKYGQDKQLKPTNEDDLFQYNYFLHYIEGTLMPILVMKFIFMNLQKMSPWIIKPIVNGICNKIDGLYLGPNIRLHLDFLEGELKQRTWLAGEQFSGADVQASFAVEMLVKRSGIDGKDKPQLVQYVNRMCERPAYKRAMEKVGKTSMANN